MRFLSGLTATLLLCTAAAVLAPAGAQPAPAAAPVGIPVSLAELTARLQPAVVSISIRQSSLPDRLTAREEETPGRRARAEGSGFIISADGYVVTNNHVISPTGTAGKLESALVTLADGRDFKAVLVGRDKATDLAVLKIEGTNLPFVQFGDSSRTRVGDWVVVMGNPLGVGMSVGAGIVSAIHRGLDEGPYDRFIQTDASINRGNSGGPMFDLNGRVIGINSIIISPTGGNVGLGFAIPEEQARGVVDALRRGVPPPRGYLGFTPQAVEDEDLADALGIPRNSGELVRSLYAQGPADVAGIIQGDVITRVNGRPVNFEDRVPYLVASLPVGQRVPVEIIRDGKRQTLTLAVEQAPTEEELAKLTRVTTPVRSPTAPTPAFATPRPSTSASLGLYLQSLTPEVIRSTNLPDAGGRGVMVSGVDPVGNAAEENIRRRDIILAVNQHPTDTAEEVADWVEAARREGRKSVALLVMRRTGAPYFVGVEIAQPKKASQN